MSQEQSQKPPSDLVTVLQFVFLPVILYFMVCFFSLLIPIIVHNLGYAAGAVTKAAKDGYSAGRR